MTPSQARRHARQQLFAKPHEFKKPRLADLFQSQAPARRLRQLKSGFLKPQDPSLFIPRPSQNQK